MGDDAAICHPACVLYFNSAFKGFIVIIVKCDNYSDAFFAKLINITVFSQIKGRSTIFLNFPEPRSSIQAWSFFSMVFYY